MKTRYSRRFAWLVAMFDVASKPTEGRKEHSSRLNLVSIFPGKDTRSFASQAKPLERLQLQVNQVTQS